MSIEILGVRVDPLTQDEVMGVIDDFLQSSVPHYIVTVNPEFVVAAQQDSEFRSVLNRADLALADGIGVLWAASFLSEPFSIAATKNKRTRFWWCVSTAVTKAAMLSMLPTLLRGPIRVRVSGSDIVPALVERSQERGFRIALVGGQNGVANQAANALLRRFPTSHIVLADSGLNCAIDSDGRLQYDTQQQVELLKRIRAAQPDVVFVGFGARKQEKWIVESFRRLPNVKLFMGVGGAFDMIAGVTARAPRFYRDHGIEWVWRWALEPWRASRMLTATVRFMSRVGKEKYHRG